MARARGSELISAACAVLLPLIIRRVLLAPQGFECFSAIKNLFLLTRLDTFIYDPPEKFKLEDYIDSVNGEEVWVAEQNNIILGFVSMWLQDNFIHNLFYYLT